MASGFLDLPYEIRLEIYRLIFGSGKAIIEANSENDSTYLLPQNSILQNHIQRTSQLLRVNKTILSEARPVLYANTTFHVLTQAFAGKLPVKITDGHPSSPFVRNLIWQLDCDMLKHCYVDDLLLDTAAIAQWTNLELRCRAESWRDSFLGEWCDREAFVAGRDQLINYARVFLVAMESRLGVGAKLDLVEDRSQLGRGRVILKVTRSCRSIRLEVLSLSDHQAITETC